MITPSHIRCLPATTLCATWCRLCMHAF